MKVWFDSQKSGVSSNKVGYVWSKTPEATIELLKTGEVTSLSLGDQGYDVLVWMEETNTWPETVQIHSINLMFANQMLKILNRHEALTELLSPLFCA